MSEQDAEKVTLVLTREQADSLVFGSVLWKAMVPDLLVKFAKNERALDHMIGIMVALDAAADQLQASK